MGRGRDPRTAQDGQQAHQGQQAPYGQQGPYGRPTAPPHGQWQASQPYGAAQQGGQGEPEYFGDGGYDPRQAANAPYSQDNSPGGTRQFSIGEAPDAYGRSQGSYDDGAGPDDQYGDGGTYRAGGCTGSSCCPASCCARRPPSGRCATTRSGDRR